MGSGVQEIQFNESEPDRRAAKQQRVQQQIQIQVTIHAGTLAGGGRRVNLKFGLCTCCGSWGAHNARAVALQRKITGGLLAALGFMLSPLSWWNDAFVNLPLAVAFGWLCSFWVGAAHRNPVFNVAVVVGYWLTNVLGFVLMHRGVRQLRSTAVQGVTRRELWKDLWISLGYTALIVVLLKLGVLKPVEAYFAK